MENAVYNHLVAHGFDVKTGSMPQGREIDFIAEKGHEWRYIRVAVTVDGDATATCEFGNLARIPNNYEKAVVTLRDSVPNTHDGIRQISLREFLMDSYEIFC